MGQINVRSDSTPENAIERFIKDSKARIALMVERKKTEIQVDTYNARLLSAVKEVIEDKFNGRYFICNIIIYDKRTVVSLKVNSSLAISTEMNSNILLHKLDTMMDELATTIEYLLTTSNSYKNIDALPLNLNYNEDESAKPKVNLSLETRTKYF